MATAPYKSNATETPQVRAGRVFVYYAFDIGFGIDLDRAEQLVSNKSARSHLRRSRRTPQYFEFDPPPLKVVRDIEPVALGSFTTRPQIEITLYDFGGASVAFEIPIEGALDDLIPLSNRLYDEEALPAIAREAVDTLGRDIAAAVNRPALSELVEDYAVYQISALNSDNRLSHAAVIDEYQSTLAAILSAEDEGLSQGQISETLATRLSYGPNDVTILDWNAALLFDDDADDVLAVLEYTNVELLEMRLLDDRLDDALDQAYELMTAPRWWRLLRPRRLMARVAEMQLDGAFVFEGVNNAVKLLGDQYLARVYQLASQRLHLKAWDRSVIRKLDTLRDIYHKLSDMHAARRSETLEWIIILLIAFEIGLTLSGK